MAFRWSDENMKKFIELYHKHDCLWNYRSDSYKNRDARSNATRVIAEEMQISGFTAADVKNKIKSIRTVYNREKTLVKKSEKSGTGTDDLYVPKVWWYKRADVFLSGVASSRSTSSNLDMTQNEVEQSQQDDDGDTESQIAETESESDPFRQLSDAPSTSQSHVASQPHTQTTERLRAPHSRKRKLPATTTHMLSINAAIDKLSTVAAHNTSTETDEHEIFGKWIAAQLRQMSEYDALLCQGHIQSIIREQRLQRLSNARGETIPPHLGSPSSVSDTSTQQSSSLSRGDETCSSYPHSQSQVSDILSQAFLDL